MAKTVCTSVAVCLSRYAAQTHYLFFILLLSSWLVLKLFGIATYFTFLLKRCSASFSYLLILAVDKVYRFPGVVSVFFLKFMFLPAFI